MQTMEKDLGTRLDWIAADHFNTGRPHSHIVLRGKDEAGKDLVIARDYIAHGMHRRASELATLEFGPRTGHEIRAGLERRSATTASPTYPRNTGLGSYDVASCC